MNLKNIKTHLIFSPSFSFYIFRIFPIE